MQRELVKLDQIHINLLNPRHLPQESEEKEFEQIIENGQLEELIKDIAKHGLDPSENLLLTFNDELKSYVVEEGNRRVTALKLMKDPDSLPIFVRNREKYIKMINNIIKENNYRPIDSVVAVIMEDILLMNHFIELKHTKNHGGAGRVDWDTESQIRFKKKKDPFTNTLLELLMKIIPGKTNNFNITTVLRIISDPDMRNALSLTIDKPIGQIKFNKSEGFEKFKFIVKGLSNKTFTVGNFHSKKDRIKFIEEHFISVPNLSPMGNEEKDDSMNLIFNAHFPEEEVATPPNNHSESVDKKGGNTIFSGPETNSFSSTTNKIEDTVPMSDSKRTYNKKQTEPKKRPYFFYGINYNGHLYGIEHSLFEIHQIEAKKFPLSSTMLFRTLFECVIQQYILINNLEIKSKSPIESLSIASLLKTITDNSNGNYKVLEKSNNIIARILNEANAQRDQDELNIVTHGNHRAPSYTKLEEIERRWYIAIKMMIENISGQN